ncbi:MAG: 30S ribosomal protein S7 [Holosporaceae bacterium]
MRRHRAKVRPVAPDPKFGDEVIARFVNALMLDGKKAVALRIMYQALEKAGAALKKDGKELFYEALSNVKPSLEIKSRRVGGATYPVPTQVRAERSQALAIRWMIASAKARSEKTMADRLANEFRDSILGRSGATRKKEEAHKQADANRAFSHYRW